MQSSYRDAEREPQLSVIIPTRNEAANIAVLLGGLTTALADIDAEIIFVDDSDDNTAHVVRASASQFPLCVRLIERPPERRDNGLGGAVVEGFRAARADWLCVMDADLQHPPSVLPRLLQKAQQADADLVLGSRLAREGDAAGLSMQRNLISRLLALATKLLFPMRLRPLSDPLTGLFLLRNGVVDWDQLQPDGFKILLEIVVRFPLISLAEVPFRFEQRHAGESKAGFDELLRLLRHFLRLRYSADSYLIRYFFIGFLGLFVNSGLLYALVEFAAISIIPSVALALQLSTLLHFFLAETWIFDDRRQRGLMTYRALGFVGMNNLFLLLRLPIVVWLIAQGVGYLWANVATIVLMSISRFAVADQLVWQRLRNQPLTRSRRPVERSIYHYLIGPIRIRSRVRLPDLDPLSCPQTVAHEWKAVDLDIEITHDFKRIPDSGVIHYSDGLGRHGFCLDVEPVAGQVRISPFLARSPHVLYAHVVEPLLRWLLVRQGWALVHAAAVIEQGRAALLTAPTGGGKTTEALCRLQAGQADAFAGDDMVLLAADGWVAPFPKRLHVSRQTLRLIGLSAARRPSALSTLLYAQFGRDLRWLLQNLRLPVASLNALVQRVAPPSRYTIDELLPGTAVAGGRLTTATFIGEQNPDPAAAAAMLLANSEDAFRFPPYPTIGRRLSADAERDLQHEEFSIMQQALTGVKITAQLACAPRDDARRR